MPNNRLELGKWNVICDRCGFKFKSDEVMQEWTGLIVCRKKCFETRHPQDFVRPVKDDQSVPFTRPEAPDQFVSVTYDTVTGTHEYTIPSGTFTNSL